MISHYAIYLHCSVKKRSKSDYGGQKPMIHVRKCHVEVQLYRLVFLCVFSYLPFVCFRPDGEKKAYVRLAPDYDALDVANKVSLHDCYWCTLLLLVISIDCLSTRN